MGRRVSLASLIPAAACLTLAYIVNGPVKVWLGVAAGGYLGMYLWVRDSPPPHIEKWRTGSEGERRTAKALRRLEKDGWRVWHDIERRGGGNFDHVVVGPPGIFVLDTKNNRGVASVENEMLRVQQLEDPEDRWTCDDIAVRMRSAAAELCQRVTGSGSTHFWVHPVVVLWQDFPQRVSEIADPTAVYFVHGDELVGWLQKRAPRLSAFYQELAVTLVDESLGVDAARSLGSSGVGLAGGYGKLTSPT